MGLTRSFWLPFLGCGLAVMIGGPPAVGQVRFHSEASGATVAVTSWRDIPFRTVVRQQFDYSCGSAALATLLTYHYGRPTTEPEAFKEMFRKGDQAKIRKVGFSMLDMKRFLETHGIKADGFRADLDELARAKTPVIALIDLGSYRHFVIIKGVLGDKVLVGDPAQGLRTYSRKDFLKVWNGVSFSIHDTPGLKPALFNAAAEWRPWAVAPVGAVVGAQSVTALTNDQMPLYQISPVRVFDAALAGISP